jgi:hypothetical protein
VIFTESFSTIPKVPATEEDSKVNMELSRWNMLARTGPKGDVTHVEGSQLLPVCIELVVVEVRELL